LLDQTVSIQHYDLAYFVELSGTHKWRIYIIISAHNINYKNYWCGEWLSWWELEKISGEEYSLKGQVRANTYYYEEGNVQFNLKTDFNEEFKEHDEKILITDVISKIEQFENRVNKNLILDTN
jgi:hypothetical protein